MPKVQVSPHLQNVPAIPLRSRSGPLQPGDYFRVTGEGSAVFRYKHQRPNGEVIAYGGSWSGGEAGFRAFDPARLHDGARKVPPPSRQKDAAQRP